MGAKNSTVNPNQTEEKPKVKKKRVPMQHLAVEQDDVGVASQDECDAAMRANMSESGYEQFVESVNDIKEASRQIGQIPYQDYEYPFENLVFEGGGAKGQVYIGGLQVFFFDFDRLLLFVCFTKTCLDTL